MGLWDENKMSYNILQTANTSDSALQGEKTFYNTEIYIIDEQSMTLSQLNNSI